MKKKLFLYQVYRYDRKLFRGMVLFSLCTLLANLAGVEATPFFVWGMYSEKEPPVAHYDIYKITVNDTLPVDYTSGPDNNRFYLLSPLSYYKALSDNQGEDPTITFLQNKLGSLYPAIAAPLAGRLFNSEEAAGQFMDWYRRYIEESGLEKVRKIQIDVVRAAYNHQLLVADSTYTWKIWKVYP